MLLGAVGSSGIAGTGGAAFRKTSNVEGVPSSAVWPDPSGMLMVKNRWSEGGVGATGSAGTVNTGGGGGGYAHPGAGQGGAGGSGIVIIRYKFQ